MVTRERYAQGMTLQQYLDQMQTNRDRFVQRMALGGEGPARVALTSPGRRLHVLVITEDWCGDSLAQFPILARMVEGNADVELRVFLRDRNPDLMEQYLKHGRYRTIPVFVFFDEQMNERARVIERPPAGQTLAQHLADLLQT
jgi:Thioredoxin